MLSKKLKNYHVVLLKSLKVTNLEKHNLSSKLELNYIIYWIYFEIELLINRLRYQYKFN